MQIVECEQGTPEWFLARRGIPTASMFGAIITPKTGKVSAQIDGYICQLLAEKYSGGVPHDVETYTSRAMQMGIDTEPEARAAYGLTSGHDVVQVGFCLADDGRSGCSPDGLIGDDGGLELKCPLPKTQVQYLIDGTLPDTYKAQVHGSLIVTGRKWWDFYSYCPGLPELRLTVEPDDFTDLLRNALARFAARYDELETRLVELGAELPEVPVDSELDEILF
jgi:hypothetical protein